MQRAFSIVLALAAVVLVAVLTVKSAPKLPDAVVLTADAAASTDAGGDGASRVGADAGQANELDLPGTLGEANTADDLAPAHLAAGAPRHVRFGVILVEYEGAEGAATKTRSKRDALALATKLAADAQTDFKGAVERGDTGSSADVGTVQRGVLEPAPEAAVFALKPGEISGVIDTPRGFWIAKRIE